MATDAASAEALAGDLGGWQQKTDTSVEENDEWEDDDEAEAVARYRVYVPMTHLIEVEGTLHEAIAAVCRFEDEWEHAAQGRMVDHGSTSVMRLVEGGDPKNAWAWDDVESSVWTPYVTACWKQQSEEREAEQQQQGQESDE